MDSIVDLDILDVEIIGKICTECGEYRDFKEFHADKRATDKKQSACKYCQNNRIKLWSINNNKWLKEYRIKYLQNPENKKKKLASERKRKYNISEYDYNNMLSVQNNKCAICEKLLLDNKTCVDHCHKNGATRGILCNSCNVKLGWYEKRTAKIIKYLDKYK